MARKKKSIKKKAKTTKVVKKKKKKAIKKAVAASKSRKKTSKAARKTKAVSTKKKKATKTKSSVKSKPKPRKQGHSSEAKSSKKQKVSAKAAKVKGSLRLVSMVQKVTLAAKLAVGKSRKKKKASSKKEALVAEKSVSRKQQRVSAKKKASTVSKTAEKEQKCREPACGKKALLAHYCRLHYIKNWQRIKRKGDILSTGRLDNYIEGLVEKYPDKYLDAIEFDLSNDREWANLVGELESGQADDVLLQGDEDVPSTVASKRVKDYDDEEF